MQTNELKNMKVNYNYFKNVKDMKNETSNNHETDNLRQDVVIPCPFLVCHYGSPKFKPELVLPVKNSTWWKPTKGGLWTSPIDSTWGWKDWNNVEHHEECDEEKSFIVEIKKNSKILIIDSLSDLLNAPLIPGISGKILNFEFIATKYDAIWLTFKGQRATHLSYPIKLYGWDCETILILNSECVEPIFEGLA